MLWVNGLSSFKLHLTFLNDFESHKFEYLSGIHIISTILNSK